ncbi:MAG: outer membrane lipoprotein-sorting protein [Nitrospiria bacterium]
MYFRFLTRLPEASILAIRTKPLFFIALFYAVLSFGNPAFSQDTPLSGAEIIRKSNALLYQIEDQKNTVTLMLVERDGTTKKIVATRSWKNYRGEGGIDSKMLLITRFPEDSRGVAFLVWDYAEKDKSDDLWLYLPALRMIRRISGQDLNDAFLGSDLTFGDMGQRRIEEDEHALLKEEHHLGAPAYVVVSTPKEAQSIYSKKVSWISKTDWTILKIDYYDRAEKLLKRQTIEWQEVDQFSVWEQTQVTNVQNGHRTIFKVSDLTVNMGLQDQDFTERALKRDRTP